MNRNTFASLTLCLIVVILTACQPVKPTPTATDQIVTMISATATVAPTLASATVPPTFAPTNTAIPTIVPTATPLPATATVIPPKDLITSTWILANATDNKEIAKDPEDTLTVNGVPQTDGLIVIPDPHLVPIKSLSLTGYCLRGYQLVFTAKTAMQPENWLIRVLIDGQERSDCGSQLTITATDATFSVRNPATYGPVQYPHGTTMAFDGLPPVLGVLNTAGTNTWTIPFTGIGQEIAFTFPGNGPICHHSWSLSATPDYVLVYVWAEADRTCKT